MHHLTIQGKCWPWSRYKTNILTYISIISPFCFVPYEWSSKPKCSCSCNHGLNIWLSPFCVFTFRYLKWKLWHTFFFCKIVLKLLTKWDTYLKLLIFSFNSGVRNEEYSADIHASKTFNMEKIKVKGYF